MSIASSQSLRRSSHGFAIFSPTAAPTLASSGKALRELAAASGSPPQQEETSEVISQTSVEAVLRVEAKREPRN